MTISLRVLFLADQIDDVELMLRELCRVGFAPVWQHVNDKPGFEASLVQAWDAIIATHSLPLWNVPDALQMVQALAPDIPCIIVSETHGEELAVVYMKQGAADYLLKDQIARLGPAVTGALEARRLKHEKQSTEKQSEQLLPAALDAMPAHIAILDETGTITAVNETWRRFADENQLNDPDYGVGTNYLEVCRTAAANGDDIASTVLAGIQQVLESDQSSFQLEYPCHSPSQRRWFELRLGGFQSGNGYRIIMLHYNITARKLAEQYLEQAVEEQTEQLLQSTERIESILNSSSDAILLIKKDGVIEQANPTYDQWFGNDHKDVYGQPFSGLITPDHIAPVMEALRTVFATRHPERIEIVAQRNDGTTFDADVALYPVLHGNNELTKVVCSMRDITKRKQAEHTLRQTLVREVEISDMRMRFLSMATHDLRNPLAVIRSGIDMLEQYHDRLPEDKKKAKYEQIRASIFHMVKLLDDILLIGRVEAGRVEFEPKPVQMKTFCQQIITEIGTSTGAGHTINLSVTGTGETRLMDPKLLRHIVHNLISNAVKYSSPKSAVNCELVFESDHALFHVTDHGIGIPAADQPRLFEAFHRASNVGVVSGTGLGLAIVKRAVELHGGTITFESEEGSGSTFTVMFPNIA